MNYFSGLNLSINYLILLSIIIGCCSSSYFRLMKLSSAQVTTTNSSCTPIERDALIAFKQSLTDPSARLSSWDVSQNCCQWSGITCDFISGKVTKIDLQNSLNYNRFMSRASDPWTKRDDRFREYEKSCLGGKISPSLLHLEYLNHLDLSLNNFEGAPIPYFFGMFKNLRYLNLSYAYFGGEIPHHLGNLSKLKYLDLFASNILYKSSMQLQAENLHWLSGLSSLKYLDIGWVDLRRVQVDWIHMVNSLSSLSALHLQGCGISSLTGSISFVNLTSLKVLDLSYNSLFSPLPLWLTNLTTLVRLDLSGCTLQGTIPRNFMELKNLKYLDLSSNLLGNGGHIPSFLRNLCKLQVLNLGFNSFSKLDEFLGGPSNCSHNSLESLYLSHNQLVGELPNSLGNFENLRHLYLSYNNLSGTIPNSIGNLSLLQYLHISENILNGTIPPYFGQLSNLISFRSLQNSGEAVITETQLVNLTKLKFLEIGTNYEGQSLVWNVSHDWIPPFRLKSLYLINCFIGTQFPVWLRVQTQLTDVAISDAGIFGTMPQEWFSNISSQIFYIDLSNNFLSGCIPSNIGDVMPNLIELYLSKNHLNGTIPSSMRGMSNLQVLSLSDNKLSGELLDNWSQLKSLCVLDLANNNLSGEIPSSIGLLTSLGRLILNNNYFYGEIPKSLQNCSLTSIDLSENRLHGNLPSWIGVVVSKLWLLNLRSNLLIGTIPRQWCNLSLLRVLDLSNNDLSGEIPSCLYNWTAFIHDDKSFDVNFYYVNGSGYYSASAEKAMLVMKGRDLEFEATLKYVLTIDLSRNRLSGEIPNEITNLTNLNTLNLSMNHLVGSIPKNIGDMRRLETFDLSCNSLSENIPTSLSSLTSLSHLNLSYNNLTGRIPGGMQLQTLDDPSIYEGNPFLCGSFLHTKCPGDESTDNSLPFLRRSKGHDEKHDSVIFGFYMSMVIGFPVGLNILFFTLLIKKRWRASYSSFIDGVNYDILHKIGLIAIRVRGRRRRRWRRN